MYINYILYINYNKRKLVNSSISDNENFLFFFDNNNQ